MRSLKSIMLVDDNVDDNFFHERAIRKSKASEKVIVMKSGKEALEYLTDQRNTPPDLILLDINMPGMNGWEFLEEYKALAPHLRSRAVVVMLSTSENPDDMARASESEFVSAFKTKPLTEGMLREIIDHHY